MRLTLLISSLGCGGAERVVSILANHWVETGHSVTLITMDDGSSDFYPLDERVQRITINLTMPSTTFLHAAFRNTVRIFRIRKSIIALRPDAVISFTDRTNIITLLAAQKLKIPVIVSERTDPSQHRLGPVWNTLRDLAYPRAAAIVVQTQRVRKLLIRRFSNTPIHVIPNPINSPSLAGAIGERTADCESRIIAVGRLSHEKGMDLLLRAFARACRENPRWKLTILGQGPERLALERLITELSLSERTTLEGQVNSPFPYFRNSDIFVLPSRYEGFPNALLEAMSCGLATVSFDCPSGPKEIVRDGYDGLLVPSEDIEGLARALSDLMRNPRHRRLLGERAIESVRRFALPRVSACWLELVAGLTDRNGRARPTVI